MSNKNLGAITIISYSLALVLYVGSSYTDDITAWNQLAVLASYLGFFFAVWGAIRLAKM